MAGGVRAAERVPVRPVLAIGADSGETPVWSAEDQCLYWVDQERPTLNRFDPASGKNTAWTMPAHCSSFALRGAGQPILVALRTGLADFDPTTGSITQVAPPPYEAADIRFNDGRCDRQGRYVVGECDLGFFQHGQKGRASLHSYDGRGLRPILDGLTVTNGLAFSPDGTRMYLADTLERTVFVFDYDTAAGTLSNRRVFVELAADLGLPDGAEMDSEGGYWVGLLGRSAIARFTPDGALDLLIDVPALQPTKMAFGGPDLATLYVTSAAHRHIPGDTPMGDHAGDLFAMETGFKGISEVHLRTSANGQ